MAAEWLLSNPQPEAPPEEFEDVTCWACCSDWLQELALALAMSLKKDEPKQAAEETPKVNSIDDYAALAKDVVSNSLRVLSEQTLQSIGDLLARYSKRSESNLGSVVQAVTEKLKAIGNT
jgi:hypothetical protein